MLNKSWGPKPFRAFDDWLSDLVYQKSVVDKIDSHKGLNCFLTFKNVKMATKSWSRNRGGNPIAEITKLEQILVDT